MFAALLGLSIPISSAATNMLGLLCLLSLLLCRACLAKWRQALANPVTLCFLALYLLFGIGLLYAVLPLKQTWSFLLKYSMLLYPLMLGLILDTPKRRETLLHAFFSAILISLFFSYVIVAGDITLGKGSPDEPAVFKHHITHSLFVSLALYLFLDKLMQPGEYRWFYALAVILCGYNVLFMTQSRSGYIMLFSLTLLWSWQYFRVRGLLAGFALVSLLFVGGYLLSDTLHTRMDNTVSEAENFRQGEAETSTALRLEFWRNSWTVLQQHPWLGSGTGSFSHVYQQLAQEQGASSSSNPHNEYLLLAIQLGLPGVLLFIALLVLMWRMSGYIGMHGGDTRLAQALVVFMAVGCVFNSLLSDFSEGHAFAFLAGVLYAGLDKNSGEKAYEP